MKYRILIYQLIFLLTFSNAPSHSQDISTEDLYESLEWNFVGPYRGGRSTAVAGVISRPYTFFMGTTGGGVWKTTDAGNSWENISDGQITVGSIGAISVAPSDENIIYEERVLQTLEVTSPQETECTSQQTWVRRGNT